MLEAFEHLQAFRGRFNDLVFVLKDLAAFPFDQHADGFAHAPSRGSKDLKAVDARNKQGDAAIAHDSHAFRKPGEGLKFKASEVDALELVGGIQGKIVIW